MLSPSEFAGVGKAQPSSHYMALDPETLDFLNRSRGGTRPKLGWSLLGSWNQVSFPACLCQAFDLMTSKHGGHGGSRWGQWGHSLPSSTRKAKKAALQREENKVNVERAEAETKGRGGREGRGRGGAGGKGGASPRPPTISEPGSPSYPRIPGDSPKSSQRTPLFCLNQPGRGAGLVVKSPD